MLPKPSYVGRDARDVGSADHHALASLVKGVCERHCQLHPEVPLGLRPPAQSMITARFEPAVGFACVAGCAGQAAARVRVWLGCSVRVSRWMPESGHETVARGGVDKRIQNGSYRTDGQCRRAEGVGGRVVTGKDRREG